MVVQIYPGLPGYSRLLPGCWEDLRFWGAFFVIVERLPAGLDPSYLWFF